MLELNCSDVVEGCPWSGHAETEDELMAKAARHAENAHQMVEIPAEVQAKVREAIHAI
ncbi:MAG: DUF1059 domain-containing protein [Candidatus Thermoplasmatota archaeon]|nr:DUF1059 domain-containing protein [Candidatus Thermoplasmatota archaeon]